ncbi:MAG: Rieske 2Fe-2S domain-containing protein [Terriglobia bacterium]
MSEASIPGGQGSAPPPEPPRRLQDRVIGPPPGARGFRTALVVFAFACCPAAGVGFLYIFWTGGSNLLLGATWALSFAGLGCGFVLWEHWLMSHDEATEPREILPSPEHVRESMRAEFLAADAQVQRRKLMEGLIALGVAGFAAMFISLFRSLGTAPGPVLMGAVWKRGQRLVTLQGKTMSVSSLRPGDMTVVFPEDSVGSVRAQTVLIRVEPAALRLPKSRENWAPQGYLAYSRVCTHAGCPVGEYEATTELLLCPCHQSTFDVLDGAQPTGGPAARALPQLPLYAAADGTLRAAGDFSAPPGPGFWTLPPTS